jgi:hypothetical protein
MIKRRIYGLFFLASLLLSVPTWAGPDDIQNNFSVFMTTNLEGNMRTPMLINVGSHRVDEFHKVIGEFRTDRGESILPDKNETVDVIIIVPKGAPEESREDLKRQIAAQMKEHYPKAKYEIKESFVDLEEDKAALEDLRGELNEARQKIPPGTGWEQMAKMADQSVTDGLEENRKLKEAWWKKLTPSRLVGGLLNRAASTHPYATEPATLIIGMVKFGIAFTTVLTRYGDIGGPLWKNAAALGLAVLAGGVSYVFGYNAKAWRKITTEHIFPWMKDSPLVKFYNRSPALKSAHINFWRSLVITWTLRMLAAATKQTTYDLEAKMRLPVEYPLSLNWFATALYVSLPEVALDGNMEAAMRALEEKGRLNHQSYTYLFQAIALIDTTMHALIRSNLNGPARVASTVSIASKLGVISVARWSPPGRKRIVFVSDQISTEKTADYAVVRGQGFAKFLGSQITTAVKGFKGIGEQEFPVSDRDLVARDNSLEHAWKFGLSSTDMDTVLNDPSLTIDQFRTKLGLGDLSRDALQAFWKVRNDYRGKGMSLPRVCAEALHDGI